MRVDEHPRPVPATFRTRGVALLVGFILVGAGVAAYRFLSGLSAVTNLDQQHPWGLWIAIDVATGVALAAGGFTTAALVYVFHREDFHAVARPALLTAMLGYTFVGLGLMADLGRYYNIWHPAWPTMWQGNSVLFEVGMCVMVYLTVLYVEFLPAVCDRFVGRAEFPRLGRVCGRIKRITDRTMIYFILAGVVLSCLHQSSLGNLMLIAPTKMNPLWYTPILGWLFLLSAIAVGFPMVIVESLYASWSLRLKPETHLLSRLAKYIPALLGIYLAFKLGDMVIRESYAHLAAATPAAALFAAEVFLGLVVPMVLLMNAKVRRSARGLLVSAMLVVLGVALNRVNVFLVAYQPPYEMAPYFPSVGEFAVTIGLISALILVYRILVTHLPVITAPEEVGMA